MPSNATTHGFEWPVTYNRQEDGTLTDLLLTDTAADLELIGWTDRAYDYNNVLNSKNWAYDHPVITYVIINPPNAEFEERAKGELTTKMNQLDFKGRQTAQYLQTIIDHDSPIDSLYSWYAGGKVADIALIWAPMGPLGGNYTYRDSTGVTYWGDAEINELLTSSDDYGFYVLMMEFWQCFAPSPRDANPDLFPQYQRTFFADNAPPPQEIYYDWGNGPNGMVNYRGLDIAVEILKTTMKLDYLEKYGNGVRWNIPNTPRIIIPETTID